MRMVEVSTDKKRHLALLLLGDEQESMIDRYLERGELFALLDDSDAAVGVCVVTDEGEGSWELKNLAVAPSARRRGWGRRLVAFALERCREQGGRRLLVGTGDSLGTLSFYRCCGFVESHRVEGFFIHNYDHPIMEEGRRLVDMVYLAQELRA